MSVIRISSRYAKSLLDLAVERSEIDTVYQDMLMFKKMVSNRDLYLLLKSPIVNTTKNTTFLNPCLMENICYHKSISRYYCDQKKGKCIFLKLRMNL
ncbi:MAG: F0F1 ATP synthase subunit delta [Saprospiraceae bacterium]|nr:F0F1 ATP synthase subunit delta [Saprospiraceae bacterium]